MSAYRSFRLPHGITSIARAGRVGEDPREEVGVDVMEFQLKQALVVSLLLTAPGDGEQGHVLLTVGRPPSPVDYTERPTLCTARWV